MKNKIDTRENIVEQKIPLSDIKDDSREFEIMKKAAENGNASAQHSMGIWYQEIAKAPTTDKRWYERSKTNIHPFSQ